MQIILQENSYGIPCDKLEVVLFRTVSESEAPPLDPFAMLVVGTFGGWPFVQYRLCLVVVCFL